MIQRFDNVGVAVPNLQQALKFYVDQIGLTLLRSYDGPLPGASVGTTETGPYLFLFETGNTTPRVDPPGIDLAANPMGMDHLSFLVDNVDESFAAVRDRGGPVILEPCTDTNSGLRMGGFRDPAGNVVYLIQWV